MIVPDVNVLLYAHDAGSRDHAAARAWWEGCLSGSEPVRLAWVTLLGFIRIATHPRVFRRPMTVGEAVAHVSAWLARPMVAVVEPGPRHWDLLSDLLLRSQAGANLTTDAHLAAVAIEHGGTVHTSDRDFWRFKGLRVKNPIEQGT